ncbi:MAG TPA: bifunctional ADP-heptose synthase [Bacteroidales bacterium]|nr:bifunctional ADP-heptose synthase [Bacteroidales bacterium]
MLGKKEIKKYFGDAAGLNVLIVGDVMIDSYIWGTVDRISPEAPVPIVTVNRRASLLGGAANVALNIKAMGGNPILCSVIGNDSKGNEFLQLLEKEELTTEGIVRSKDRITTTKFRIIGNNYQMLRVDEETDAELHAKETEELLSRFASLVKTYHIHIIIIQDYNKGVLTPKVIQKITSRAGELHLTVAVDPKKRNFSEYKSVSLFKPNLKELIEGLKIDFDPNDTDHLREAVQAFQKKQDIDHMLVTLSDKGVFISSRMGEHAYITHSVPAYVRTIADVSGAGDTVISLAALCLALKMTPLDIATISNLAGGLVCESVGVVPINKSQLLDELMNLVS